jgi:hypothetical protein
MPVEAAPERGCSAGESVRADPGVGDGAEVATSFASGVAAFDAGCGTLDVGTGGGDERVEGGGAEALPRCGMWGQSAEGGCMNKRTIPPIAAKSKSPRKT